MPKLIDMTGRNHGRLTVISRAGNPGGRRVYWNCVCACGGNVKMRSDSLKDERYVSCGCYQKEIAAQYGKAAMTHGESNHTGDTAEYRAWVAMINRCENPNYPKFHRYGGRGISISKEWRDSYKVFLSDMGRRPSNSHSLDRKNNDGNYEHGNCRWATPKEQANNRRKRVKNEHTTNRK